MYFAPEISARKRNGFRPCKRRQLSETKMSSTSRWKRQGPETAFIQKKEAESIDADTLKLMRTQDLNYIALKKKTEDQKIDKMLGSLHSIAALETMPKLNKHTVFIESDDELEDAVGSSMHGAKLTDKRLSQLEADEESGEMGEAKESDPVIEKLDRRREAQYRELAERMKRREKLRNALHHVEVQRNLMQKGRRTRIKPAEDGKPPVFVWKSQRKR
mmetsp:Transcript_13135/g.36282  ORF Transcript_13135/g.36282 Transcript_13135/m.36282 type:complete len:217 (-) Transcript_13135:63-713(-)